MAHLRKHVAKGKNLPVTPEHPQFHKPAHKLLSQH